MKPTKITIEGDYIDCQIYRGRLYLWTINGQLCVYDWDMLINYFEEKSLDKTALRYAFSDGDSLYELSLMSLFEDEEFKQLLLKKFQSLESKDLFITKEMLSNFKIGVMDCPLNKLPIDTQIYDNTLYYIAEDGLYKSNAHKKSGNPVSTKSTKLWDARALSITANKYPQIAISAGTDGLYELNIDDKHISPIDTRKEVEKSIFEVCPKPSSFANYSNLSIYSSSVYGESYLAYYTWNEDKTINKYFRDLEKVISESELFNDNNKSNLSWGIGGRVFKLVDDGFETVEFSKKESNLIQNRFKSVFNNKKNATVIGGTSTYYGNIIEFDDSMLIVQTDGDSYRINSPITRWRTYPRSKNYANQLHVILDNCIEIYSFNHDYFLPQINKLVGIEYVYNRVIRLNKKVA